MAELKKKLQDINRDLEGVKETDLNDVTKVKILKDTSDSLFAILGDDTLVANVKDHKDDLAKSKDFLDKRKEVLGKQEIDSGLEDTLNNGQDDCEQKAVVAGDEADVAKIKSFERNIDRKIAVILAEYTTHTEHDLITMLPIIYDDIKTAKTGVTKSFVLGIISTLKIKPNVPKEKMAVLIIHLSNIYHLIGLNNAGKAISKDQIAKAENILNNDVDFILRQLEAYQRVSKTTKLLAKRLENLGYIKTDGKFSELTLDIDKKKNSKEELKGKFVTDLTKLEEEINEYEISSIQIKINDKKGGEKLLDLYQDDKGTKVDVMKIGGTAKDLFVYNEKDKTYKKVASINLIDEAGAGKLEVELEAYQDMPKEINFPVSLDINMTGVGSHAKDHNKVGATKHLALEIKPADFEPAYDDINLKFGVDKKLKELYDNLYDSILETQLDEFFKAHPSLSHEWETLSWAKKRTFFVEVVQNNRTPRWCSTIPDIDKVWKKEILKFAEYEKFFKEKILKDFDGRSYVEFKTYILEKLGTLGHTKENAPYAQKVMADEIISKYSKPDEEKALGYALNKFLLGIDDASIMPSTDAKLLPGLTDLHGEKDLDVAIADTEMLSEEKALEEAKKEFASKYASSMKRGLGRAKMFFFRSNIINKKVKEKMGKSSKKLVTDAETSSAVNRRMLKKEFDLAGADKIKQDSTVFTDPEFQRDLNMLTNEYLQNPTADEKMYELAITKLINNNKELKKYMETENITQIGSNLAERVRFEKRQRMYYADIQNILHEYEIKGTIKTRAELDVALRKKLAEFSKEQNKLPDLVKELNLDINSTHFAEQLANHHDKIEHMRMRTVNMRVNMLTNVSPKTKGLEDDNRGLTTAQHVNIDKLGGRSKFYRWIEKHPYWTALGTAGALIGTATLGALTLPIVGTGLGAGALFSLNYLKKRGHYTKEHVKFEKELLAMKPDEREAFIEKLEKDSKKKPDRLRKVFPSKYNKYAESMKYLESVQAVEKHIADIERYLNKTSVLDRTEKGILEDNVVKGIAAMQLQETEGRNFAFSDEGKANIEQLYNKLYKTILGGIQRYDSKSNPIDVYNAVMAGDAVNKAIDIRKDVEYAKDKAKMSSMRNKLGMFAGAKAAGIYLGTAYIMGQIGHARHHMFGGGDTVTSTVTGMELKPDVQSAIQNELGRRIDFSHLSAADKTSIIDRLSQHGYGLDAQNQLYHYVTTPGAGTGLHLDPAFGNNGQDLLKEVFAGDTAKFQAFQAKMSALSPNDRTTTLRGTMKDLYGTNQIATEKTRAFFDYFGNSIMERGQHELITLTSQSPLSANGADAIANKMTTRYANSGGMLTGNEFATVTDPTQIKALFEGFAKGVANGGFDLNHLPAGRNIQTANDVLHCKYAGFGDGLKEYIFDLGNKGNSAKEIVGKVVFDSTTDTAGRNRGSMTSAGVPTVRNEVNNFNSTTKKK